MMRQSVVEKRKGDFHQAFVSPLKPRSRAKTIAWARVHTPSLSKRLDRWFRTVFSLTFGLRQVWLYQ